MHLCYNLNRYYLTVSLQIVGHEKYLLQGNTVGRQLSERVGTEGVRITEMFG